MDIWRHNTREGNGARAYAKDLLYGEYQQILVGHLAVLSMIK